jgi:hypothetical protein
MYYSPTDSERVSRTKVGQVGQWSDKIGQWLDKIGQWLDKSSDNGRTMSDKVGQGRTKSDKVGQRSDLVKVGQRSDSTDTAVGQTDLDDLEKSRTTVGQGWTKGRTKSDSGRTKSDNVGQCRTKSDNGRQSRTTSDRVGQSRTEVGQSPTEVGQVDRGRTEVGQSRNRQIGEIGDKAATVRHKPENLCILSTS